MQNITWKTVVARLQQKTKLVDVQSEEKRVKSLIYTGALKLTSSEWLIWKEERITVANGMAKMPCDLIRLLKAWDTNGKPLTASREGEYMRSCSPSGQIIIHYYALPLVEDEDGNKVPRLLNEYLEWYVWFVIHEMMMDEWIEGKLGNDKWGWIEQQYDAAYNEAIGSIDLLSITDMEQAVRVMQNGIFYDNKS